MHTKSFVILGPDEESIDQVADFWLKVLLISAFSQVTSGSISVQFS